MGEKTKIVVDTNVNNSFNYKFNIGDIIKTKTGKIKILEQIMKNKRKSYKYQCLNDGYIGKITEGNIVFGKQGCPVCSDPPRKILKGYNDMWTTNPEQAKLLLDPNDGYKYTQCSGKSVNWKCPECGNIIKDKTINIVKKRGLRCPNCSDHISYPEKYFINLLQQLNIDYTYQLTKTNFNWCNKYKYDFYITNYSIIVEVNGGQHYGHGFDTCGGRNHTEEQENDRIKKELAIKNGIKEDNYIVIDCRESNPEWIKKHIINSKLNNIFDLNNINWLKCHEFACSSLVKKICDLWNTNKYTTCKLKQEINLDIGTIIKYLKQGTVLGWCKYDPEEEKKKSVKKLVDRTKKKIINLDTKEIFNSRREAAQKYNICERSVGMCCQGIRKSAGGYRWCNYE